MAVHSQHTVQGGIVQDGGQPNENRFGELANIVLDQMPGSDAALGGAPLSSFEPFL
ncbi:MAG TPA: hypothetical protein VMN36_19630 [Verrucomicrobiales bacterium]|nr:hypothetical protein [Verrucomicrobiales bacterium]